ncbi:MAG TPA: nuclear transport factor 2 family protein [Pyrinomonadaceae bacterium]|nr:nuclear transport factor 2 family protein [Pyrinomonadaceae bacterium]
MAPDVMESTSTRRPAADEAQRKRSVESADITGNAAVAKLALDYPEVRFTDYMTLLKIEGEWKIVNKAFYAEPKAK